jgi:hypothetical protein
MNDMSIVLDTLDGSFVFGFCQGHGIRGAAPEA